MATDVSPNYSHEDRWKAVMDHAAGVLVVNAGPGTGKTYSLVQKVGRLMQEGVEPDTIYYLTFVNSIVEAFKHDIRKPVVDQGLGVDPDALGIHISTLHSLAFKIVKTYAAQLHLSGHLEAFELSRTTKSTLGEVFIEDLHTAACANGHTANKNELNKQLDAIQDCWQCSDRVPAPVNAVDGDVTALLARYESMPWDRLVPTANEAIEQFGLPSWLSKAKHFLVDEYQDFNPSEQKLISLVSQPSDSVVIVGDMDQSIYSGRSASPAGLRGLLDRDDVTTVNFVWCRRCPRSVIGAANKMLELIDPTGHAARALQPKKTEDGICVARKFKSCKAEIEFIAQLIKSNQEKATNGIVIVMAGTAGMEYYQTKLREHGIRCELHRTTNDKVELTRAYLRLAVLRAQPLIERLLIHSLPALERRWIADALPRFIAGASVRDSLAAARASAKQKWRQDAESEFATFERERSQLTSGDATQVHELLALKGVEVPTALLEVMLEENDEKTAGERVEEVMKQLTPEKVEEKDVVKILTMHSSKGLSKSMVIIPAAEDKLIPGTSTGAALEEKHRLFYVALTRAEDVAIITFPATRAKGDPLNYQLAGTTPGRSRYLKQAGLMA